MTETIKVLLCDDVAAVRALLSVALALEPRLEVVAEAENGLQAIEQAARYQPDVVVLDLSMPLMDGLEALPEIRRVAPGAKVVVLSGFGEGSMARQALALGAVRYLEKGIDPATIVHAIEEVSGSLAWALTMRRR